MEQLTLEQAAGNHSRRACVTHVELKRTAEEIDNIAFQAGAEWQKEQFKELLLLIKEAMVVCSIEGQDDIIERIEAHISNLGLEL